MNMQRSSTAPWRRWMQWSVVLLLAAMLLQASPAAAQQWNRDDVRRALQATVLVIVPIDAEPDNFSTGSATVLDAERGIVLTNFHVMGDTDTGELYNSDSTAYIAVNPTDLRGTPVIKYVAELVRGDPAVDLAVLRITGLFDDENAALPTNLGLISIDRGNSDDLLPGDPLAVVGFPGLGGATVTFTDGVVSGFLDEDEDGVYEWIKTDTEINPGNSGGLAIDQQGDFIGVPTAGYSRADVAGKISLIRPGAMALDYYDRAIVGQGNSGSPGGKTGIGSATTRPGRETAASAAGVFGPITFAGGVSDDDQPLDAGNAFVEVGEVYAFFSVTGLRSGAAWESRWLLDGEQILSVDETWEGGDTPSTWVSLSHPDGLPAGEYTLELHTGGALAQSGSFIIESGGVRRTDAGAVNVTGVVHDADNSRKTIAGASIYLLNPGVTVEAWVDADFDESMIAAYGESVRGGKFQLDAKLARGEAYSVVVVHDDYQPLQVDGFEIPEDATDPYELDVPLEKG